MIVSLVSLHLDGLDILQITSLPLSPRRNTPVTFGKGMGVKNYNFFGVNNL